MTAALAVAGSGGSFTTPGTSAAGVRGRGGGSAEDRGPQRPAVLELLLRRVVKSSLRANLPGLGVSSKLAIFNPTKEIDNGDRSP